MSKPLAVDLFCGLGGWSEGFLAAGYDVVGFDIEHHVYGAQRYPAQLVLQDVLTLHGAQFKNATVIVASPPCQAYSYRAMPWKKAKALPPPSNELFEACFRIQREASEAAGRYIPLVVENVKGAQPWVGRAAWHYGSFYLWGDVPALMPSTRQIKRPGRNFHAFENGLGSSPSFNGGDHESRGVKTVGHANIRDGYSHTRHLTNQRESDAVKIPGQNWSSFKETGNVSPHWNKQAVFPHGQKQRLIDAGVKNGNDWFGSGQNCSLQRAASSGSTSRKAASAQIAKIPFELARHIAYTYKA